MSDKRCKHIRSRNAKKFIGLPRTETLQTAISNAQLSQARCTTLHDTVLPLKMLLSCSRSCKLHHW